jgi:LmbE family N-acetylglucosaminyl deacetylase
MRTTQKNFVLALVLVSISGFLFGQAPKRWTSSEIHESIQKLNVLGSALYIAAHPDDENTRMISYLSNELKVNTAYMSLTRGDGGQNLIGPELQELLGVIRTQELLAARRVDGGKQFFSRASDFGFSKHPDETLKVWNKDEVLSDVVWVIRNFQPDIIINRFDHESAGRTHGHHTSSAVLSYEAFDLVGNANAYPEQLKYVDPWQPERLFFNTSWWFYGSRENFNDADKSDMLSVDIGVYYPMKGKSNSEIAAESRSMHKCQGMGRTLDRGSQMEFLQILKGELPKDKENVFGDIDISWTRVPGGKEVGELIKEVERDFQYQNPGASVPKLMEAYRKIIKLPADNYWRDIKLEEIKEVISACMGLYVEALSDDYSATPGQNIELSMEIINRSKVDADLISVEYLPNGVDSTFNLELPENQDFKFFKTITIPKDADFTSPYWLNKPWELGMYSVDNQKMRGKPETPRIMKVRFNLSIEGQAISWTKDVVHRKTDPVDGEVYRPFEILPPVFVNIQESAYIYANQAPKPVQVVVRSGIDNLKGKVMLDIPEGWRVEPESAEVDLKLKGGEQVVKFDLYPPEQQSEGTISAQFKIEKKEKVYNQEIVLIEYDHIPTQTVLRTSQSKVVKIDLKRAGQRIGYIMGAGDKIPTSLEQVGYTVELLEDKDIQIGQLQRYDAVILGIRAYNTVDRMKFYQPVLLEYVNQGGTLITQYNTTWRLPFPSDEIAPFHMKLSRDRVTVEEAPVTFLKPNHPVLNEPNKITQKDFEGWVQERGLYFPNEWGEEFDAILSCHDPGEEPKDGGLLVAKYGKGYYIYTGYSWFRELPAGVPGAYRLFTNMISIGKGAQP